MERGGLVGAAALRSGVRVCCPGVAPGPGEAAAGVLWADAACEGDTVAVAQHLPSSLCAHSRLSLGRVCIQPSLCSVLQVWDRL